MAVTAVSLHSDGLLVTASGAEKNLITPHTGENFSHANAGTNQRWAIDMGDGTTYLISRKLAEDVFTDAQLIALTLPTG